MWNSVDLFITLLLYTVAVGFNIFFAFRVAFLVKNNQDPINVFKKNEDKATLQDVFNNQKEYDEINGI